MSLGRAVLRLLHQCFCARSRTRVKFNFNNVRKTSETYWISSAEFLYELFPPRFPRSLFRLNSDCMWSNWWHWISISHGDTPYHWKLKLLVHCHQWHHTDVSCPKSIIFQTNYSASQISTFLYIHLKLTRKHSSTLNYSFIYKNTCVYQYKHKSSFTHLMLRQLSWRRGCCKWPYLKEMAHCTRCS